MLYQLATQVGADDAATAIKDRLVTTLDQWTEPQGCAERPAFCFVYDEEAHGMVGMTPSFGSEEFNDHHFHYGYLLFAAGLLGEADPALVTRWAPVMDLVAADLGSAGGDGAFPDLRVFDVYAGHSWASGTSPFADGNNQESSSEAAMAWTGLATWAAATGNETLRTQATWMLSLEAQSGATYWTDVDRSQPVFAGLRPPGRLPELGWQAGLRHLVLRRARGHARHPAHPDDPGRHLSRRRPGPDRGQRGRGDRWSLQPEVR